VAQVAIGRRPFSGTDGWAEAQQLSGMPRVGDPAALDLFAVGQQ